MPEPSHVALAKCFYCLGDGAILLHKRLGDISEAHGKVVDMTPCSTCEGYQKQGVIVITISDTKSDPGWSERKPGSRQQLPNPFRTGGFFVIRDEAVRRMFNGPMVEQVLRMRWTFIEHEAAMAVGLFASGMTEPYREHRCDPCAHSWLAPVVLSKSTNKLSGEATTYCPLCNQRAGMSSEVRQP